MILSINDLTTIAKHNAGLDQSHEKSKTLSLIEKLSLVDNCCNKGGSNMIGPDPLLTPFSSNDENIVASLLTPNEKLINNEKNISIEQPIDKKLTDYTIEFFTDTVKYHNNDHSGGMDVRKYTN